MMANKKNQHAWPSLALELKYLTIVQYIYGSIDSLQIMHNDTEH